LVCPKYIFKFSARSLLFMDMIELNILCSWNIRLKTKKWCETFDLDCIWEWNQYFWFFLSKCTLEFVGFCDIICLRFSLFPWQILVWRKKKRNLDQIISFFKVDSRHSWQLKILEKEKEKHYLSCYRRWVFYQIWHRKKGKSFFKEQKRKQMVLQFIKRKYSNWHFLNADSKNIEQER
jgi:hypothetical protein